MSRVLKWPVPIDDDWHEIGSGPVVLVDRGDGATAMVWTIEPDPEVAPTRVRFARVFGTGHELPRGIEHLGSYISAPFVWHVFGSWGAKP